MFTGIVEDVGTVVRVGSGAGGGRTLTIQTALDPSSLALGDSICTSGVCLTAVQLSGDTFTVDAGPETLGRTTIGQLQVGARVNLERSVTPQTRLGGHLVMGHVDAVGYLRSLQQRENAWDLEIAVPAEVLRLAIPRGSICVDGISLTITDRSSETFSLSIIPHTWKVTTLGQLKLGGAVNVEADVIARYVDGLMAGAPKGMTFEFLKQHGFG